MQACVASTVSIEGSPSMSERFTSAIGLAGRLVSDRWREVASSSSLDEESLSWLTSRLEVGLDLPPEELDDPSSPGNFNFDLLTVACISGLME